MSAAQSRSAGEGAIVVELRGVSKVFGPTRVLDEVACTLSPGVTAILGGNGAGKSTLLRIVGGVLAASEGTVAVGPPGQPGRPVRTVRDALGAGVRFIHQEGSLIPAWTVAQHFREPALAAWRTLAPHVGGSVRVERLGAHDRQLVEVARALQDTPTVVLADEPTAGLTAGERDRVFGLLRAAASSGAAVAVVTHDLEAVLAFADRVLVLRGGRIVLDGPAVALSRADLLEAMGVAGPGDGRDAATPPRTDAQAPDTAFNLRPKAGADAVAIEAGVVTGVVGGPFSNAGGMIRAASGLPAVGAEAARPRVADSRGADLHGARRRVATMSREASEWDFPGLPLAFNLNAATFGQNARWGVMDAAAEARSAQALRETYAVVAPSLRGPVERLSGGNRQKAVLARLAAARPDVLLLDEPFSGVDAPTRAALAHELVRLAAGGMAVGVYSQELPDLVAACHRIAVVGDNGRIAWLDAADATPALIEGAIADNAVPSGAVAP